MPPSIPDYLRMWLPLCQAVGQETGVDGLLLLAVMDRESAGGQTLKPVGPSGVGDGGNALGLMQVDKRFHPQFAAQRLPDGSFAWQAPNHNVRYAANFLRSLIVQTGAEELGVAAYNAGLKHVQREVEQVPELDTTKRFAVANALTAHGDYASDVLLRRARFRFALTQEKEKPP